MGSYAQALEHKQALSDFQFQNKVNELIQNRQNIQAKLPSLKQGTPDYDQALQALQQNAHDLRNLYHPEKNPGMVAKFGHILTDHLGITKPQDRANKQAAKQAAGNAQDIQTAQGVAAAAPVSPDVIAAQQTQAQIAAKQALADWTIDWAQKNGITGDALEELKQHVAGLPLTKPTPLTGAKPYKGADGRWYQAMRNADGTITEEAMPADYQGPATKMSGTQLLQDSYLAAIGLPSGTEWSTLSNAQRSGYELYLNGLKRRFANHQAQVADRDGNIHIIDLSSSSGPVEVAPPAVKPQQTGAAQANPTALKGEANKVRPSGAKTYSKGDIVLNFKKATPDYTKAKNTYNDTDRISKLADKWIQHPNSEADANFVLALIRSEAGRVNQQEIAQMFNAGGIAEAPERWAHKVGHGELPPDLRQQIVDFVHDMKDAAKEVLDENNNPDSGQGGTSETDPLGVLNASPTKP